MRPSRTSLLRAVLAGAALSIFMLAPAAAAQAPSTPSVRYAVGSPGLQAAVSIARTHWGVDPCGGVVELAWTPLGRNVNGISSWTVAGGGAYDDPAGNQDCRIELNTRMAFSWSKLCTVVVHEYGHLVGHDHDEAAGHLMSAIYTRPLPACVPAARRR